MERSWRVYAGPVESDDEPCVYSKNGPIENCGLAIQAKIATILPTGGIGR